MGALPIPAAAFHWAPRMSRAWLEPVRSLLKALVSAVLTTYCKDGRAHNVPVWCHWTGEAFEIVIAKPPCGSCQPCGWSPRRQQHTLPAGSSTMRPTLARKVSTRSRSFGSFPLCPLCAGLVGLPRAVLIIGDEA